MPFQPGNEFWKARSSHGRKPKFADPDQLWNACVEYFEWVDEHPLYETELVKYQGDAKPVEVPKMRAMTLDGLCIFLDIGTSTWADYCARDDFTEVTTRVDRIIRTQKFQGAAAELLNPNIIARDLGLAEKNEHTGKDGAPIKTEQSFDLSNLDATDRAALRGILTRRAGESKSGAA